MPLSILGYFLSVPQQVPSPCFVTPIIPLLRNSDTPLAPLAPRVAGQPLVIGSLSFPAWASARDTEPTWVPRPRPSSQPPHSLPAPAQIRPKTSLWAFPGPDRRSPSCSPAAPKPCGGALPRSRRQCGPASALHTQLPEDRNWVLLTFVSPLESQNQLRTSVAFMISKVTLTFKILQPWGSQVSQKEESHRALEAGKKTGFK